MNSQSLPCKQCGILVKLPKHRWDSFRFCSRKCGWAWHNENHRVPVKCKTCDVEFQVIACREKTARYCSRKCYYKAMNRVGSIEIECTICGKIFHRPPSRIRPSSKQCCSLKCRGLLKRVEVPGVQSRVWFIRRGLLKECNRCGYNDHPEILVIHHRDKDRSNNIIENLEILCPNCHAFEHYAD